MVGHYLLALTPEAETDVLTSKMAPGSYMNTLSGTRCLVGCAADYRAVENQTRWRFRRPRHRLGVLAGGTSIEVMYDDLCARFGHERVNTAIRNRILSNQARRALAGQREVLPCR